MGKDVALVLSSGGPRGLAYIGAIEELERRGYNITSVAGCSAGSLVGGIYAAGGLEKFKEWIFSLNNIKIMSMLDFSVSKSYLVKGEKVINAIKEVVPDVKIENLRIPFCAVATDLYTGEEVVFDHGDLYSAIRASISIPSMFRPFKNGYRTLVDGGLSNTLPINRVARNGKDILVAFDVNQVDKEKITEFLKNSYREKERRRMDIEKALKVAEKAGKDSSMSLIDKVRIIGDEGQKIIRSRMASSKLESPVEAEDNYYTIIMRSFNIMNHSISEYVKQLYPVDVLVEMSFDAYGAILDYGKGKELAERGRELMAEALDKYEHSNN